MQIGVKENFFCRKKSLATISNFVFYYIPGGLLLRSNQAFRISPTNRGSSLHSVPGLPAADAPILAAEKSTFDLLIFCFPGIKIHKMLLFWHKVSVKNALLPLLTAIAQNSKPFTRCRPNIILQFTYTICTQHLRKIFC